MMTNLTPVRTKEQFEAQRKALATKLWLGSRFDRGEVHAQKVTDPLMATREITYVNAEYWVPEHRIHWSDMTQPNYPWAEDHFQERISGKPLNPPPSSDWWPYAQAKNTQHKKDELFSHTYPERIWCKEAGVRPGTEIRSDSVLDSVPNFGIRYGYGDLDNLVSILKKNPRSRQAYLPIWFPEDLEAADQGERVPCTLGYHFMLTDDGRVNCFYPMRSCDFLRFMVDDIYMAGRLLQHIAARTQIGRPGSLNISISSLHVFEGDMHKLQDMMKEEQKDDDEEDWDTMVGGVAG